MQGGLIVFLIFFVALSAYSWTRLRGKTASLSRLIDEEYRRSNTTFSSLVRPALLPIVVRAWWISAVAGAAAAVILALTPLSYFPNFTSGSLLPTEAVELKTLNADLQSDPMRIDGEVINISGRALPKFRVHLILYDRRSTPVTVRTIEMRQDLRPNQTLPFFFTEPRSESVKRVGVTFSSQYRSLVHRESAEVKQRP